MTFLACREKIVLIEAAVLTFGNLRTKEHRLFPERRCAE
jgi:hypothetical protein